MGMSLAFKKLFGHKQEVERPACANLLYEAQVEYRKLKLLSSQLQAHGLANDEIPDHETCLGFAYMLEADRANQLKKLNVDPMRLIQLLGTKDASDISTPQLRLLNVVSSSLAQLAPLQKKIEDLDIQSLQPLDPMMFNSVNQIEQNHWSHIVLKAEISPLITHIILKFTGLAIQPSHFYTVPVEAATKTNEFTSQPFLFDEGTLHVLAKDTANEFTVKNIPMKFNNKVQYENLLFT